MYTLGVHCINININCTEYVLCKLYTLRVQSIHMHNTHNLHLRSTLYIQECKLYTLGVRSIQTVKFRTALYTRTYILYTLGVGFIHANANCTLQEYVLYKLYTFGVYSIHIHTVHIRFMLYTHKFKFRSTFFTNCTLLYTHKNILYTFGVHRIVNCILQEFVLLKLLGVHSKYINIYWGFRPLILPPKSLY